MEGKKALKTTTDIKVKEIFYQDKDYIIENLNWNL